MRIRLLAISIILAVLLSAGRAAPAQPHKEAKKAIEWKDRTID